MIVETWGTKIDAGGIDLRLKVENFKNSETFKIHKKFKTFDRYKFMKFLITNWVYLWREQFFVGLGYTNIDFRESVKLFKRQSKST